MGNLVDFLCILGLITMIIDQSRLLIGSAIETPIGSIFSAGVIRGGAGVSMSRMRVLGKFALVLLVEGLGRYADANGKRTRVVTGDTITIFPEVPHGYGPGRGESWSEVYVVFGGGVFDSMRETGLIRTSEPVVHNPAAEVAYRRILGLFAEHPGHDLAQDTATIYKFAALFSEFTVRSLQPQGQETWVGLAKHLLSSDLDKELPLIQVAEHCGHSYELFRKRFQALVGASPGRYRSDCKMDAAKHLLRNTTLTGAQIAAQLGFCDEFQFSKRFKQRFGHSPRACRMMPSAAHPVEPRLD